MQLVFFRDRKVQIAVGRNLIYGTDKVPHTLLSTIERVFALI